MTDSNYLKRLGAVSTPNISDTLAKGLSRKLKHQVMDTGIRAVTSARNLCGTAYTVRCYPGATYAMECAIAEAPAGSVLVCDGQGSEAGVMMGELMSTFAKSRGILGAVIDGAVRDLEELEELIFPMFARHVTPRNGTFDQLGDAGEIISCGGVVVRPGDVIRGDVNGVVVLQPDWLEPVTEAAEERAAWEDRVKEKVLGGMTLDEAAGSEPGPTIRDLPD
jgi:4-hydroxy-4-methyl-2-oxoglutarate aldolase